MSTELTLLVWSTVLLGAYICVQAVLYRIQYGIKYSAGPRDAEPPPQPMTERGNKRAAQLPRNYGASSPPPWPSNSPAAPTRDPVGRADLVLEPLGLPPLHLASLHPLAGLDDRAVGLGLMFFGVAFQRGVPGPLVHKLTMKASWIHTCSSRDSGPVFMRPRPRSPAAFTRACRTTKAWHGMPPAPVNLCPTAASRGFPPPRGWSNPLAVTTC